MTGIFTWNRLAISLLACPLLYGGGTVHAQHSVARQWNEVLLNSIRNDFARPTVHARNLFHISAAMYDAWAAYDEVAEPYFLGKNRSGFLVPFEGISVQTTKLADQQEAISFAAYRLLLHRFLSSPGGFTTFIEADSLMLALGYNPGNISTDYLSGDPAALGNYIAQSIINFGLQDGANELRGYGNTYYTPVNGPLDPYEPGTPRLQAPNYWQPLELPLFIDQGGNPVTNGGLPFLSPEWGNVVPFALRDTNLNVYERDGHSYRVFHDPGSPAYFEDTPPYTQEDYQWGHALVAIWGAHLDPADGVVWDISPRAIGNLSLPSAIGPQALTAFYRLPFGGDPSQGHAANPSTGQPYEVNLVFRGDYTRVLAEFWADGPDSETPPGHWFTILNYVNDHPLASFQFEGEGPVLSPLEWDVKAYFILGGAMHDAAVAAWSVKGYYDYIRPISAIRYLASLGQRTDPTLPAYHPQGLALLPGYIELVTPEDSLAGPNGEHVDKIKLYTWRGPTYIADPETDIAGVGWILAENWWPYQRPSFVTPPFAGYVSGHSTFSRAAAEVLTLLTGDPFFPGGMGEFVAEKNEFLVFEEGPSETVVLQWATYRDASDQTSLSRIWGGIHPPVDDLPGRLMGEKVGIAAFDLGKQYLSGTVEGEEAFPQATIYPSPVRGGESLFIRILQPSDETVIRLLSLTGQTIETVEAPDNLHFVQVNLTVPDLVPGVYLLSAQSKDWQSIQKVLVTD